MIRNPDTVVIENVNPQLDGGRYAVKRTVGQELLVEADIYKDGHDIVTARLKWRKSGSKSWQETEMRPLGNDRWEAAFVPETNGSYEYTIEAWGDTFLTWREEVRKKYDGGVREMRSEALEGSRLLISAAKRAGRSTDAASLKLHAAELANADDEFLLRISQSSDLLALMSHWPDRSLATEFQPRLRVWVDRPAATFAAWYEFFPRSAEGKPHSGSTFRQCISRIEDARAMGFDVIYFPPIHPIGETNRKGRNNSLRCEPGEPGVPYAIGNYRQGVNGGGHKDVAPELGTLEDFAWLVEEVKKRGMEIALDFAINCSPDHPYVKEHPEWFFKRPDGTIKFAENPPKKYEDVFPLNFHNPKWKELWQELRDVLLFWCKMGVKIFRVDNPHTKPVAFWEWVIAEVQNQYPDAIFLSEAFTKPKMMKVLAKAGFTQSYTYFTWRNTKAELSEYFTELTRDAMREYFRPNLFPNTPDILPYFLQDGGRPAFLIRATLAATLSPVYGIYSGFELCENTAVAGKEEYLDSEKYQFKGRDWNAPGNIKDYLTRLNRIRCNNRSLQEFTNLEFIECDNPQILFFSKTTPALDNTLFVAINLDPHHAQSGFVNIPLAQYAIDENASYQVHDLLTDETYTWQGHRNYLALDPNNRPAHILRLLR